MKSLRRRIGQWIARNRRSRLPTWLAQRCANYLSYYNNVSWEFEKNGESRVLKLLSLHGLNVIFDVGSNTGQWASLARGAFPGAEIHCFEIIPKTAAVLKDRFANCSNVIVNSFGLSDSTKVHTITYRTDKTPQASLVSDYPLHETGPKLTVQCQTIRGDDDLLERETGRIDFLKLDVEGSEGSVLAGFGEFLNANSVTVIQFEYSRRNIVSGFLLRDLYAHLESRGFRVGKIFPNHINFRDYGLRDEDFRLSNFLAVAEDRPDLIDMLA